MHEKAKSNFACFHEHQTQLVATSLVFVETVALFSPPSGWPALSIWTKDPKKGSAETKGGNKKP